MSEKGPMEPLEQRVEQFRQAVSFFLKGTVSLLQGGISAPPEEDIRDQMMSRISTDVMILADGIKKLEIPAVMAVAVVLEEISNSGISKDQLDMIRSAMEIEPASNIVKLFPDPSELTEEDRISGLCIDEEPDPPEVKAIRTKKHLGKPTSEE